MRVNINVAFDMVEEIDASENSVDLADLQASGMGPGDAATAVMATIEHDARKARGEAAAPNDSPTGDYPLDPDQD